MQTILFQKGSQGPNQAGVLHSYLSILRKEFQRYLSPIDPATDTGVAPAVQALIPWLCEVKEMQHSYDSLFLQALPFQDFAQMHGFLMARMSVKP